MLKHFLGEDEKGCEGLEKGKKKKVIFKKQKLLGRRSYTMQG